MIISRYVSHSHKHHHRLLLTTTVTKISKSRSTPLVCKTLATALPLPWSMLWGVLPCAHAPFSQASVEWPLGALHHSRSRSCAAHHLHPVVHSARVMPTEVLHSDLRFQTAASAQAPQLKPKSRKCGKESEHPRGHLLGEPSNTCGNTPPRQPHRLSCRRSYSSTRGVCASYTTPRRRASVRTLLWSHWG